MHLICDRNEFDSLVYEYGAKGTKATENIREDVAEIVKKCWVALCDSWEEAKKQGMETDTEDDDELVEGFYDRMMNELTM